MDKPNWQPIRALLCDYYVDKFMWMGRQGDIELYKHYDTRHYLNIDARGHCYEFTTDQTYKQILTSAALKQAFS